MSQNRQETTINDQTHQETEDDLVQDIANNAVIVRDTDGFASRDRSQSGAPAAGRVVRDIFSTDEIFQRLVATADEEFGRSARMLFFSGLAAGLSIGLSFMARAALTAELSPDVSNAIGNLLYPIGFIFIVMGRYQLFTENTLTPVTLVLTRIASVPALLIMWALVLAANITGAVIIAWVLATTNVLEPPAMEAARAIGEHALQVGWFDLFVKGIFAGWLVAGMVWIIHAVRDSITRFVSVYLIMYLIPTAGLFHCIVGACEGLYMFFIGEASFLHVTGGFFLPVVLGNTLGGVLLVAILNYGQTRDRRFPEKPADLRLSWRDWLLGYHTGGITAENGHDKHADQAT